MDLGQVITIKEKLEKDMRNLLLAFEKETGLTVQRIKFERAVPYTVMVGTLSDLIQVNVVVEI